MVAHVMATLLGRGTPTDAVVDVHRAILELRRETVVELIAPCHTVEDVHALVGIVLVEALVQVLERDTVGYHVCTC